MKMKNGFVILPYLFLLLFSGAVAAQNTLSFEIEDEEYWWGCFSNSGINMPLGQDSEFSADLFANNASNQAQPFMLSSHGRYFWSENPFRVSITDGKIVVDRNISEIVFSDTLKSLKSAFLDASSKFFPSDGKIPDEYFFTRPQYNTWIELIYDQNQKGILEYAKSIIANGFAPGVLMIDDNWQEDYGNWTFSSERFPDPEKMIDELHEMGFKVMLWVCPFVSPDSRIYRDLNAKGYLLHDRDKVESMWKSRAAAMVSWWNGVSAVLDLSNPGAFDWFYGELQNLVEVYGIDGFKFDAGDSQYYTADMKSFEPRIPNQHTEDYMRLGTMFSLNEFRASWKYAGRPLVQRLSDKGHRWSDLSKLIPNSIVQGLLGYSYTCPDMIGGGEYKSFMNASVIDQELIVRSAQIHALMPMMQFSVSPWRVLDKKNLKICREMAALHVSFGEYFLLLAKKSSITGEPILRPMCWSSPGTENIKDQFMIGEDLVVAPIVTKNTYEREVFLPEGVWKDDLGEMYKGPVTIRTEVPLNRLPYYRKER